jgi:hypothetical protein
MISGLEDAITVEEYVFEGGIDLLMTLGARRYKPAWVRHFALDRKWTPISTQASCISTEILDPENDRFTIDAIEGFDFS